MRGKNNKYDNKEKPEIYACIIHAFVASASDEAKNRQWERTTLQ